MGLSIDELNKFRGYGGRFFVRVYTNLNAILSPIHTGNVSRIGRYYRSFRDSGIYTIDPKSNL